MVANGGGRCFFFCWTTKGKAVLTYFDTNMRKMYEKRFSRDFNLDLSLDSYSYTYRYENKYRQTKIENKVHP